MGSACRYLLTQFSNAHGGTIFPYGTVLANVIGSFLIGLLFVFFEAHSNLSPVCKLLLVTGVLGGFTTFSTYNMELLTFARSGEFTSALLDLTLNVVGGFIACWLGVTVGNSAM